MKAGGCCPSPASTGSSSTRLPSADSSIRLFVYTPDRFVGGPEPERVPEARPGNFSENMSAVFIIWLLAIWCGFARWSQESDIFLGSSVRSATLWFYSRKPPGLIYQIQLLTTEAQSSQRRAIFLITFPSNLKSPANCVQDNSRLRSFVLCALSRLCGFIPVNRQGWFISYDYLPQRHRVHRDAQSSLSFPIQPEKPSQLRPG